MNVPLDQTHRTIRLSIVGALASIRQGLNMSLAAEVDFCVVGEAATAKQALEMAARLTPDVVVVDLDIPQMNGFKLVENIRRVSPHTAVILVSVQDDGTTCARVRKCGAAALVSKSEPMAQLLSTIREVSSTLHGSFESGIRML